MSGGTDKVAIIGCGLIGRGWAIAFARAGWRVALWDSATGAAAASVDAIRLGLHDLETAGLLEADASIVANSVAVVETMQQAVDGASYVQENAPEQAEIKRDVFLALDRITSPNALIGSSTSTMPGSVFLADVPGRHRCIVAHPSNPPHLMPVVEIVPSPWHDDATVTRVRLLMQSIGQAPIVVKQEIEGFVLNRLQAAVINEAISLVGEDAIDPSDLDSVMKHGLGLRWALMGPFETMDLNAPQGFLDYARRYGALYESMGRALHVAAPWPPSALTRIESSREARRANEPVSAQMARRDRALMQLLAMKKTIGLDAK
jgi:L-gulonate 3-dehydrogenase